MRKASKLEDLTEAGYDYRLSRPRLPSDLVNISDLVLAESSPGVSDLAAPLCHVFLICSHSLLRLPPKAAGQCMSPSGL